jgi:hypothetical protein
MAWRDDETYKFIKSGIRFLAYDMRKHTLNGLCRARGPARLYDGAMDVNHPRDSDYYRRLDDG